MTGDEPKLSGADLARRAVQEARASGSFVRSSLGAASLLPSSSEGPPAAAPIKPQPQFTVINAPKAEPVIDISNPGPKTSAAPSQPAAKRIEVAALGAGTKTAAIAAPSTSQKPAESKSSAGKCKVWTASYGGGRAVIIRARADQLDNYTVLDVNEGAEKREADAYIAAYAKGGQTVGEFPSPNQALDKAFELCPEG